MTPVTCRCAVTAAAAEAVAGASRRKYHVPVAGMAYAAVYAPVLLVVPVATVLHVVVLEARRCTDTGRAVAAVPVLTTTGEEKVWLTAPDAVVVGHPDTVVGAPVTPVTVRLAVVAAAAVVVAGM
ncbi:hypothetical protein [Terrabacter sp. 2RAF25]|uniref:hypothetical protein n=1 Tax=Terrabacter sp. 2RAF25 TaxID=3232998 RepID=UPI003F9759E8